MALVYISWFDDYEKTWISTAEINLQEDSLQSRYTQALYFSVTIMATIGFGARPGTLHCYAHTTLVVVCIGFCSCTVARPSFGQKLRPKAWPGCVLVHAGDLVPQNGYERGFCIIAMVRCNGPAP